MSDPKQHSIRPIELFIPEIKALLEQKAYEDLKGVLAEISPIDLADGFARFAPEQQVLLLKLLKPARMMQVFEELDHPQQEYIVQHLEDQTLAPLLHDIEPELAAKLFKKLPSSMVKKMSGLMNRERAEVVENILEFPPHTVGSTMRTRFISAPPDMTARAALSMIQARSRLRKEEEIHTLFVTVDNQRFLGGVPLQTLISAPENIRLRDIMSPMSPLRLPATMDREEAADIFRRYAVTEAPVVDEQGRLAGVINAEDVIDVIEQESTEDIQKLAGVEALEEPYFETRFSAMIKKRATWLCVLFIGETLTATAMAFFEHEIARAVVLALFIPLIISSGGNSGSQASTLIVRALALKEITFRDGWRVMRREFASGLALGSILGLLGFSRIFVWSHIFPGIYGDHYLLIASAVALSLLLVVLWGSLSGSLLPILLRRIGLDPAVASAPFVATLVDVTGLIIYFSVAAFILKGTLL